MCLYIFVDGLLQGLREGSGGQIAIGPQGPRGLITPNASRFGGPHSRFRGPHSRSGEASFSIPVVIVQN